MLGPGKVSLPLKSVGHANEIRITRFPEDHIGNMCNIISNESHDSLKQVDQVYQIIKNESDLILNYLNLHVNSNLKIILDAFKELKKYPEMQEELFNFILNHIKVYQGQNNYAKEILMLFDALLGNTKSQLIKDKIKNMVFANVLELRTDNCDGAKLTIFKPGQFVLHRDLNSMNKIDPLIFEMLSLKIDLLYEPKTFFGSLINGFKNLVLDYNFLLGTGNLNAMPEEKKKLAVAILEKAKELLTGSPYLLNQLWSEREGLAFINVRSKEVAKFLTDLSVSFIDEASDIFDNRILRVLALLVKINPNIWYQIPDPVKGILQTQEYSLDMPVDFLYSDRNSFSKTPSYSVIKDSAPRNPGSLSQPNSDEELLALLANNPELQAQFLKYLAGQAQSSASPEQVSLPIVPTQELSAAAGAQQKSSEQIAKEKPVSAEKKPAAHGALSSPVLVRPVLEDLAPKLSPSPPPIIPPIVLPKCIACAG
ncbi:MAG: hypothetical protein WC860_02515 [Candidatus Margulisiibacteriota bacterium]|jgi:hypothetical protein